jgi:hypothetical protein
MNKNPLTTVVLVLLTASALASVALCWGYVSDARQLPAARAQVTMVNRNLTFINALANEVNTFSIDNPGIKPLLEAMLDQAAKPHPATAPKPAKK